MITTIKNIFTTGNKPISTINSSNTIFKKFVLSYGSHDIGFLSNVDKKWLFEYSDWFKQQDTILPIMEFPDKSKTYKTDLLWPFFANRIPSKTNLELNDKNKHLATASIVELLEVFGKRTINNPFVLESF